MSGRRVMMMETSVTPDLEYVVNVEWGVPVLYSRLRDGALFPERMERAGKAAEMFRKVIRQTVEGTLSGTLTGVKVSLLKSGVKVEQVMGVVAKKGRATGIKAHAIESTGEVNQRAKDVKGDMTSFAR